MSHSFRHIIVNEFAKHMHVNMLIAGTLCHLGYAVGTKNESNINVVNKYKYDVHGFTNFMIVDDKGNHYNVNNSIWYCKFDSIEDWIAVKPNTNIKVKYYGWRIPILGMFPIVVNMGSQKAE